MPDLKDLPKKLGFFNNFQNQIQKIGSIDNFRQSTLFLLTKFNSESLIFYNSHGRPHISPYYRIFVSLLIKNHQFINRLCKWKTSIYYMNLYWSVA